MRLNRRKLIIGFFAAISVAGLARVSAIRLLLLSPEKFIRDIDPGLYDLKIGKYVVTNILKGLSKDQLFQRISSKFSGIDFLDSSTFAHVMYSKIEADYRDNRVIRTDGWLLPETPVYISALAFLVESDAH